MLDGFVTRLTGKKERGKGAKSQRQGKESDSRGRRKSEPMNKGDRLLFIIAKKKICIKNYLKFSSNSISSGN